MPLSLRSSVVSSPRGPALAVALALAGCGGPITPSAETADGPTWYRDVAPLVAEHCGACHVPGGIAPFALDTYTAAKPYAAAIAASVASGQMPPFLAQETDACTPRYGWKHDLRPSADELALLEAWADAGAPEGDAASASPIESLPTAALPREDLVLGLPDPWEIAGDRDIHQCLVLDPGLTEDVYVVGRMITSGNPKVLHHVVSYLVTGYGATGEPDRTAVLDALMAEKGVVPGEAYDCFGGTNLETVDTEILDAWAPGGLPNLAPEGSGQPMSKESLVLLDLHYHPTGAGTEIDADTHLSLMFADSRPANISQTILLGNFASLTETPFGNGDLVKQADESIAAFLIPAGAPAHVEEMTWTWMLPPGFGLSVYGAGTHMHYVGRDMQVHLERADAAAEVPEECLIQTPSWDFNWQRGYEYDAEQDALPTMVNGDVVRMRCQFDNSMANPFLPPALEEQGLSAPVDVVLGEDTLDEMCLSALSILYPNFE